MEKMSKTKLLIDDLIEKRAKGNTFIELDIQMKLLFKGINIKDIDEKTPDKPETISKIYEIAEQFNVELEPNYKTA